MTTREKIFFPVPLLLGAVAVVVLKQAGVL